MNGFSLHIEPPSYIFIGLMFSLDSDVVKTHQLVRSCEGLSNLCITCISSHGENKLTFSDKAIEQAFN